VPVPVSRPVRGLPGALSFTVNVSILGPVAVGVNVTSIVQLAPAPRLLPQLLVWANSPVVAMLLIVADELVLLVSVTTCAALGMPTGWLPKARSKGNMVIVGGSCQRSAVLFPTAAVS
jgi:hypothetical protein